jgi:hypothetical protein
MAYCATLLLTPCVQSLMTPLVRTWQVLMLEPATRLMLLAVAEECAQCGGGAAEEGRKLQVCQACNCVRYCKKVGGGPASHLIVTTSPG